MRLPFGVLAALFAVAVLACARAEPEPPAATASTPPTGTPAATATAATAATAVTSTTTPRSAAVAPTPATPAQTVTPAAGPDSGERATVTRVIDGDTIEVEVDGAIESVRLILVDTPEISGGVECYGREAAAFTASLLPPGTSVRMERDVSERDRYGRLLRYVYLDDGRLLNAVLVAEGFGVVATFPPDVAELERMQEAEAAARAAGRGLWSACEGDDATTAPSPRAATATPAVGTPAPSAAACDPSYPDVCLPVGAADYDCAGGSGNGPNYIRGPLRVLPPDPHDLDRDGDGWACG